MCVNTCVSASEEECMISFLPLAWSGYQSSAPKHWGFSDVQDRLVPV